MARKPHAAAAVDTVHMGEAARARPLARTHVTARALALVVLGARRLAPLAVVLPAIGVLDPH